jgi:aerobic-type carbon monoxide dehydrogenase small subunit (CoxS/CutS family)
MLYTSAGSEGTDRDGERSVSETQIVRLTVNGQAREVSVAPNRLLVDLLREDLGLTGTKETCGIGVCGVCTVLLDGQPISSCLLLAVMAEGRAITTIEGIGTDGGLDPLQQAFIDEGGFQCGICTPGQILSARALLNENRSPTVEEIKHWMTGNLCRCTGYHTIVRSILAAASAERGQARPAEREPTTSAERGPTTSAERGE